MNGFSALGGIYDSFNEAADYEAYLAFIQSQFNALSRHDPQYQPRAVDLGCGTGEMALRLAERGFDVIGVDRSFEMLSEAMEKKANRPELSLFFIRQDMRRLQMDAKANLFICCYDCLNYLDNEAELQDTLEAVAAHTVSGGVLIFDVNTLYRFREYYGNRVFCFKKQESVLIWENRFDDKNSVCYFDIEVFRREGELYRRSREKHKQTWFSDTAIREALNKSGFRLIRTATDNDLWNSKGEPAKSIYVAQKL